MSIQEISAEQLAELLHRYHEALAPDSWHSSHSSPEAWEQMPREQKNRLIAAARLALLELSSAEGKEQDSRRYFAKPGEAEWGC